MIEIRPFEALGKFDNEWLSARHHFSFGTYHDAQRTGWGALKVWNDDAIRPGTGFDPHPHRDMEIVTYVRRGAITHRDNLGNEGRTEAGDVQVMSAGTGIVHAEYNLEPETTTLFQIWIAPDRRGVTPRWQTRKFPKADGTGLQPLASGRTGHEGALPIHQDAAVLGAALKAGQSVRHVLDPGRRAYLVSTLAPVTVNAESVPARAGAAIIGEGELRIVAQGATEIILVDIT